MLTKTPKTKKSKPALEFINHHAKRQFLFMNKKLLKIPVELYQRDESDGKVAREIMLHFDWVAFGCLVVIKRSDDELHIADGGTRWSAAMARDDVDNLPCMVFSGLTDEQACETFLRINQNRRRLSTSQLQHGELFAKHDLAVRASEAEFLFREQAITFESLTVLRACLKSSPAPANTIIQLMPRFAAERHVTGRVFKALVRLEVMLVKGGETLASPAMLRKLQRGFNGLDRMLCAALPPSSPGASRADTNAQAVARALHIKLPKIGAK